MRNQTWFYVWKQFISTMKECPNCASTWLRPQTWRVIRRVRKGKRENLITGRQGHLCAAEPLRIWGGSSWGRSPEVLEEWGDSHRIAWPICLFSGSTRARGLALHPSWLITTYSIPSIDHVQPAVDHQWPDDCTQFVAHHDLSQTRAAGIFANCLRAVQSSHCVRGLWTTKL